MVPQRCIRLISYSHEIVDGGPIYISSNCLPVKAFKLEPAGHAFHCAALRLLGCCEEGDADCDEENVPNDKEHTYVPSTGSYSTKGKKKSGAEGQQQDHYALLGLSHLRYLATEEQIRKSYRETALKHHPDKQAALLLAEETEAAKQAKKDEIENHFKAIQESYEVLIDPLRRRIYDSTDEFDDEIPADCAPQDFFKVFVPAFTRNGRWSVNQPVPSLAGENSHMQMNLILSKLNLGTIRGGWKGRMNAKLTALARKEESARIRALVDNAYKRDPRILKRKDEEKAEKQRKKRGQVSGKEEVSVLSQNLLDITEEDVENLCMSLEIERLRNLCEKMEAKEGLDQAKLLKEALGSARKKEKLWSREEIELLRKGMQKYPKGTSRRWEVISEYIGTGRPVEEILKATKTVLLQKPDSAKVFDSFLEKEKAITVNCIPLTTREEVEGVSISNGANSSAAKTDNDNKSSSRVANDKKSDDVMTNANDGISSSSDQDVWSAVQERALVQALKTFPKETSQRWERVAAAVPGKTVNQCKKKFALLKENFRNKKNVV
ncbi:DnaJ and Myb-like DNA-binding domain-containing protein [Actinidia rufa]|uniref:DnaJ and Myb-like DNA-binding domain-containing protein n=1 Tax=Actinidia rufa TaxID=165716 RepID=A0A7J0GFT5_9ERIC|nr:DnaJ and Myb-like DNA-binding domain-containing protein [Actinidia rufa]